jgi:multiple sugar transport system substrate-binding protein
MKANLTRRAVINGGTALATAGGLTGPTLLNWAKAWAQTVPWKPENGAQLSLLRWKYFFQGEDDGCLAVMNAFTRATGVKVNISRESNDDVQPKASVAANTGAGPDMFWGYFSLPHLFPQKCLDVSDVAEYLGKKYGGWVASAIPYGKGSSGKWIDLPIYWSGNVINYRRSSLKQAGFSRVPGTTDEFLEYAKTTKKNNKPGGFALGHATTDGSSWVHWCLWAHGGYTVDANDKVIIGSPETERALSYAKQLYENMVPGVASWNDASNNKAFLGNEIYWTANTISIYLAAAADQTKRAIAEDMDFGPYPIGPVGKPTELALALPLLAMGYTKYPQACKALMAFMMEADQYNNWIEAAQGYLIPSLNGYDANHFWNDPRRIVFRDLAKRSLTDAGIGSVGEKAAAAIADFVLVDMFANYCTGREDAKGAMKIAERQLQRIYR